MGALTIPPSAAPVASAPSRAAGEYFFYHHHHNHPLCADHSTYLEKRGLFLRSYHFSRKKTAADRVRCPLNRVLRAARTARRLVWSSLRRRSASCCFGGPRRSPFRRLSSDARRCSFAAARRWFAAKCC